MSRYGRNPVCAGRPSPPLVVALFAAARVRQTSGVPLIRELTGTPTFSIAWVGR